LTKKNEGPVRGESSLRLGNLFKRASEVNGRGSRAFTSGPGNRSTQCIVDLVGAGAITKTLQPPAIARGQLRACDAKELSGSDVSENEVSFWELCNFLIDFNVAAKTFQIASESVRESLSAAA
jgi:hypothetical protein